jgi:large subunit ribosomal protein L14
MIQAGSLLKVCDRTGVILAQCIKVLGPGKKRIAHLGDVILISIKKFNYKKFNFSKSKKKKKFLKGSIYRGLILRTKVNYLRTNGIYVRFDENSVVIVNKKIVPISNRIYGPVLRELCMKWPSLGCISRFII